MECKIFLGLLLVLFCSKTALSAHISSVPELQNEIDQLKAQVEDLNHLNAKMDLILETIGAGSSGYDNRNSRNDSSGNTTQEALLLLTERLDEVERILTDAPEGN